MANTVNLKIDGIDVSVEAGKTVLDAAKELNIHIPTLCHHEDLCVAGNCRVCVVEQEGVKNLVASCAMPAQEGMVIHTNTHKVRNARKHVVELLLSEHNADCTKCYKNTKCELQDLSSEMIISEPMFMDLVPEKNYTIDNFSPSIIKDDSKCIRCQRCVRTCHELQHVSALGVAYKGNEMKISTFFENPMYDVVCTNCGQCVNRCPTGALWTQDVSDEVWEDIENPDLFVIMQTAPSPRAAIGEEFGYVPGTRVTKKLNAAIRRAGFDKVLDTNFAADLTIMEEGTELLERLHKAVVKKDKKVKLPMFTSCSPGWVKFAEHYYPQYLDHLSSCKSPQQMYGAVIKTYYADKIGVDPSKIRTVALMPCSAKKYECNRPEMSDSGFRDVDYGLTTREMAMMLKEAGLHLADMPEEEFDPVLGEGSGAGMVFGATGGVMEAAIRTVYELVTGRPVPFDKLNVTPVRGMEGIKDAALKLENVKKEYKWLEGVELKVAVVHGTGNAKVMMEKLVAGEIDYHFIEVMACPGGCLGGGGQPIPTTPEIRLARAKAIYKEDEVLEIRKSHENPLITKLYKEYFGTPGSHKAHELLHTHYKKRGKYFVKD